MIGAVFVAVATFVVGWALIKPAPLPAPEPAPPPETPIADPAVKPKEGPKLDLPGSKSSGILEMPAGPPSSGQVPANPFAWAGVPSFGANGQPAGMNGPWEKASGYGLPNPRLLGNVDNS
jgi:hypothetical protein